MRHLKLLMVGFSATSMLLACNTQSGDVESETVDDETVDENEAQTEVASADTGDSEDEDFKDVSPSSSESEVLNAAESLESYEADVHISAGIDDNNPEELALYIRAINGEDKQLHIRADDADRTIHTGGKTYHNNGTEWVDITGDVEFNQLHRITYASAVYVFSELEGRLELTEDDEMNVYTYTGTDGDVHNLFEDFLGVSFGVVDTTNNSNEVTFQVDKETHYITQIDFESTGEDSEGKFMLSSVVQFLEFNNVDDIEAPELAE